MNSFDLILLIIIFITLWVGYARGAIALIAGFAGKILAFVGAWYFAPTFANWIGEKFALLPWLTDKVEGWLPTSKMMTEAEMGRVAAQKLPEILDQLSLPPIIKFRLMEKVPEMVATGSASVVAIIQEVALQIATMILTGLAFFVLLILAGFLIRLLISLFDLLLGGTLIGFFNRLLGMGLSAFIFILLVILVVGLTAPWLLTSPPGEKEALIGVLKSSYFYPLLLDYYGALSGFLISLY